MLICKSGEKLYFGGRDRFCIFESNVLFTVENISVGRSSVFQTDKTVYVVVGVNWNYIMSVYTYTYFCCNAHKFNKHDIVYNSFLK